MGEPQTPRAGNMHNAAVYVVAYVEVMPQSTAEVAVLLRQYRQASHAEAGYVRLEVLQQYGRSDHFAVVEGWEHEQAFEAHGVIAHTRQCRERLQPLRVSPYDERLHQGLVGGLMRHLPPEGAIYVLTHADAVPSAKDDAITLLQQLAEASLNDHGGVHFEVLQQRSRPNHFTITEIWHDLEALEAHAMAAHTRRFREQFQPLTGSLYDERLYQALA